VAPQKPWRWIARISVTGFEVGYSECSRTFLFCSGEGAFRSVDKLTIINIYLEFRYRLINCVLILVSCFVTY